MAINKNHEFEELNGVKCGIVEKNVKPERVAFLKELLEYNRFTVIAVPTPAPKVATPPPPATAPATTDKPNEGEIATSIPSASAQAAAEKPEPIAPSTFTMGVTDYTFNPVNAIFGRLLKTKNGHIVTLAYWKQEDVVSHDEVPYFDQP